MLSWFSLRIVVTSAVLHGLGTLAVSLAWGQSEISLVQLPPPPAELRQLIENGRVSFRTGAPPKSADGDSTSSNRSEGVLQGQSADDQGRERGGFSAETHFQIEFSFQSHTTWRMLPDAQTLRIAVKLSRVQWQPSHTIWLRQTPPADGFWLSPLVLHEFDHVRISSDPRFRERFQKLTHRGIVFEHRLASGEHLDPQQIRELANRHVEGLFQEAQDLIRIRYQELDRETGHGTAPLREDSPLQEVLRTVDLPRANDPGTDRP
jgi:hypothetical protein